MFHPPGCGSRKLSGQSGGLRHNDSYLVEVQWAHNVRACLGVLWALVLCGSRGGGKAFASRPSSVCPRARMQECGMASGGCVSRLAVAACACTLGNPGASIENALSSHIYIHVGEIRGGARTLPCADSLCPRHRVIAHAHLSDIRMCARSIELLARACFELAVWSCRSLWRARKSVSRNRHGVRARVCSDLVCVRLPMYKVSSACVACVQCGLCPELCHTKLGDA